MSALVIDIETAGEDWSKIDDQTKGILTERVARTFPDEADIDTVAESQLGLSPFTGEIVALGMLDVVTDKGAVYYQAPGKTIKEAEKEGIKYKVYTEKELLEKFWELSKRYTTFITYNGRMFDIPYILLRSAINGVKPEKDLMRGRYLYQNSTDAIHVDLYDQLTFYGSLRFPTGGSLHVASRAFGISTPKQDGLDGSKVGQYFKGGKYQEIAEYNGRDLRATRDLYLAWKKYLAF